MLSKLSYLSYPVFFGLNEDGTPFCLNLYNELGSVLIGEGIDHKGCRSLLGQMIDSVLHANSQAKVDVLVLCSGREEKIKANISDDPRVHVFRVEKKQDLIDSLQNKVFAPCEAVVVEHLDQFPLSFVEIEEAMSKVKKSDKDSSLFYFVTLSSLSVGVVTSELKRHFQTRIVFHTASAIDSVTLLGESGAEHLKKGQFYLLPAPQILSETTDPLLLHLPS